MQPIRFAAIGLTLAISVDAAAQSGTDRVVVPRATRTLTANLPATDASPRLLPGTRTSVFAAIRGSALTATSTPVPDSPVRLRDTRRGRIVGQVITDKSGAFSFGGVDPGSYVVELVGRDGWVLAASEMISVDAGESRSLIVKLPGLRPEATGMFNARSTAASVLAVAAASGVMARTVTGQPISPR